MKEEFEIRKEYEKIQKKYKIPEFEELNTEFELESLEKKEFLVRAIRRRMNDKVIFFCRIIENIIYPNGQSQIGTYEAGFFSDEKKNELSVIHKKLMIYERQSLLLDITPNDNGDAEYIKALTLEWKNFKNELKETVLIMENSWKNTVEEKEERYFGQAKE